MWFERGGNMPCSCRSTPKEDLLKGTGAPRLGNVNISRIEHDESTTLDMHYK